MAQSLKSERFISAIHGAALKEYNESIKRAKLIFSARIKLAEPRYILLMNEEYKNKQRKIYCSEGLANLF